MSKFKPINSPKEVNIILLSDNEISDIDNVDFTQDILNDLLINKNIDVIPKECHNWTFYMFNEYLASKNIIKMGVWEDFYDIKIIDFCNDDSTFSSTTFDIQAIGNFINNNKPNKIKKIIDQLEALKPSKAIDFIFDFLDYPEDQQTFVDNTYTLADFKDRILKQLKSEYDDLVKDNTNEKLKDILGDNVNCLHWDIIKYSNDHSLACLFCDLVDNQITITSTNERSQHVGYVWDETELLYIQCSNLEFEDIVTTILKEDLEKLLKYFTKTHKKLKNKNLKEELDAISKIILKIISYVGKSSGRSNILRVIKPMLYNKHFEKQLNNYEHLIATNDKCVVNLKTLEKIPRTREHLFSKTLPVHLLDLANNNTDFSDVERYFFEISMLRDKDGNPKEKDIIELFNFHQQIGGLCLTNCGVKHFFILHGDGNNSKSVYMHILSQILGDFFTIGEASMFISQDGNSNFKTPGSAGPHILSLYQTKICCMPEVGPNWKINEPFLKSVTGLVDKFKARPLYSNDYQEFIPNCKVFMPCNNPPDLINATQAALNRVVYVPFKTIFGDRNSPFDYYDYDIDNDFIDNLIINQLDLIFTWFCIGAKNFFDNNKKLDIPEIVKHKTDKFINQDDPIADFLEDTCDPNEDGIIKAKKLHDEYVEWFKQKKGVTVKPLNPTQFGTKLKTNAKKYNIIKDKREGCNIYKGYTLKDKTVRILQ